MFICITKHVPVRISNIGCSISADHQPTTFCRDKGRWLPTIYKSSKIVDYTILLLVNTFNIAIDHVFVIKQVGESAPCRACVRHFRSTSCDKTSPFQVNVIRGQWIDTTCVPPTFHVLSFVRFWSVPLRSFLAVDCAFWTVPISLVFILRPCRTVNVLMERRDEEHTINERNRT